MQNIKTSTVGGAASLPLHSQRLFIAQPDRDAAKRLREDLEELGYTIAGATSDAEHVVELCRASRPDMVLLDLGMRTPAGRTAAAEIFAQLALPVLATGSPSAAGVADAAVSAGVFGFVPTPFDLETLRVAVPVAWALYEAALDSDEEIRQLRQRLEDRKLIEQAKWVLVQQLGISEPDAMRTLQRKARDSRRTIVSIARSMLDVSELLHETKAAG